MNNDILWSQRWVNRWGRAACLVLLLLSAACAPTVGQAQKPAAAAGLPAAVAAVPRGPLSAALEAASAAYAQETGEPVRVAALSSAEYGGQVNAALMAGLERYDLVYLPAEDLPRWVGYSAIQPLTGSFDAPALRPWLPAVTVRKQLYGLPAQPDPAVLWYRTDLLQAAGLAVPARWEAARQAALALSTPELYGMVTARSEYEAGMDFSAVLAGFGGEMVTAQYQVMVDGEAAIQAMETYTALSAPGAERFTRADVLAALRDGSAAMGIAPFSAASTLRDCNASPRVCREGKPLLAWARLPGLDEQQAFGSLGAWAVPLRAAHGDQAQRFLAWLGSPAGARAWAQAGGIPAHREVLAGLAGDHPLKQVNEYRLAFPPAATNDLLWKAINAAIHAIVSGEQPPDQAFRTAAGQMRRALAQAGYPLEE